MPLWGIRVFLVYAMRRVACRDYGVRVEAVPWCQGKHQLCDSYAWFPASWAKRLSWKEVASVFRTSWDKVYRSVEMAAEWGRAQQDLGRIEAIGIDEIQWQREHRYLTLVYQIDEGCRRLPWVGQDRKVKTLLGVFRWFDEIRAKEAKGYQQVLTHTHWLLIKRPENLTVKQEPRLAELLQYNLCSVRAYLLKEDFQFFWSDKSPYWAGVFLDRWCTRTLGSRIGPMKKFARTLRGHRALLLNWFRTKRHLSSGTVAGLNNKAKLTMRKSYGFRTYKAAEIALYHILGALHEPQLTHRFC